MFLIFQTRHIMAYNIKATLLEPCIISVDESCGSKCIGKYSTVYSI